MSIEKPACSCCTPVPGVQPGPTLDCPQCGQPSQRSAKAATLQALLVPSRLSGIAKSEYRICMNPVCPVIYFDPGTSALFTKDQVSVRVGFKEVEAPRPLCYCFGHSWESIATEWSSTGKSTVIAAITESMRSEGCRCEVTNPAGICCLADVAKALEQIRR